ncbi:hypothetical protein SAMN05421812_11541 [Asanoa hainanensis]|uniref:Uncharacterized protein n=1 Tax=Asanoa hainanensis TaxID=560556 RepID=A0A239P988_9ACTN|nr:hypothetical protein [Asanoa hainanensis]SNT63274.1 hypothetical protein SAMN05421812_11541 [Asanoa hainanensis]
MGDDIERRLASAAEALREHEVVGRRSADLRRRADELTGELAALRTRAAAEQLDVDKLEGLSLTRVLASLRGSRDDRLARERAEAETARYRVADASARLAALQREQAAARARLDDLAHAPAAYAAVLDEKERLLAASADPRRTRLLELADERGRLQGELHEIAEAVAAAQVAADDLALVQDGLRGASGWSTYDTFFGGGPLASAMKHSRLDATAAAAARADRSLAVLRTELADVPSAEATAPHLAVDGLTRFVDVWFDNIFTDLAVRGRIQRAQENVARCAAMVDDVRGRLQRRTAAAHERLEAIAAERHDLLARQ